MYAVNQSAQVRFTIKSAQVLTLKGFLKYSSVLISLLSDLSTTTASSSTLVIASISSVLVILCIVAVLVFVLYRRMKGTRAPEIEEEVDENPVYDMYYFADGEQVDYGNSEVQDENQYYGT